MNCKISVFVIIIRIAILIAFVLVTMIIIMVRVNHRGILYKLCSVGYWRFNFFYIDTVSIKSITAVMVDGCRSKLVNIVSGVLQGSEIGLVIVPPVHHGDVFLLENKLIGYTDKPTLLSVVPHRR